MSNAALHPVRILANQITAAAQARKAMIARHSAACDFHAAMVEAYEAERDVEDYAEYQRRGQSDWSDSIREAEMAQANALGRAWQAFKRMPAVWGAIVNAQVRRT